MRKKVTQFLLLFFALLFAVCIFFIPFSEPAWAEEGEESVHADSSTFEMNYCLSSGQKAWTIQECESVVKKIIKPEMSDLEKYYTLAVWLNKHVEYDTAFWNGSYDFSCYRHQWDAYGAMLGKEIETSVCVGIAICYANLCHAADLPCKFVRTKPASVDHTMNYIPDINGNAYYVDITENYFLMSEKSQESFEPDVDKEFSHITKFCTAETFDYRYGSGLTSTDIKKCYNKPYADWFREYALHEDTEKDFPTPYEEKGSGESGKHYASYGKYPSNASDSPDVWFLDDFYRDPAQLKTKILNKEFDEQVLNISGVKKNYDLDSPQQLAEAVAKDISVSYFPTGENGKVVAKAARLTKGTDYKLTYDKYDESTNTAEFTLEGLGAYKGTQKIHVMMNSAVISKEPMSMRLIEYDCGPHELVTSGKAENGEMQYALGTETGPTEDFSADIPLAEETGTYHVWYRVVGTAGHRDTQPQCVEKPIYIVPWRINLTVHDITLTVGESVQAYTSLDLVRDAVFTFRNMNEDIISVDENGLVTGIKEGKATVSVSAALTDPDPNYESEDASFTVEVLPKDAFIIDNAEVGLSGSVFTYNGKVQKPSIETIKGKKLTVGKDYTATWSNESSQNAGSYTITIQGKGKYSGTTKAEYTIEKASNPMTLKAKTVKVRYKTLRKKARSIKRTKAFAVRNARGKLSYKLVSAKKGKQNFSGKFRVNAKTGKVTVKKGLKKGTYKVKVKVKAKGTADFKASSWKKATFKVKVR